MRVGRAPLPSPGKLDNHEWDMAESEVLKARYEHCRFVTKSCLQSLWVFGGAQQTGDRNCIQNVQLADSNPRWNVVTNGTPPSLRTYHTTSACLGDRLFVFSCREIGSAPASYSKLHDFDKASFGDQSRQFSGLNANPPTRYDERKNDFISRV
uniref:Rab9 effector protein with kelch motifs n=1 Tax=Oreochromis niloticus TaxID=8128 RepID=A0A669BU83_ORENI